MDRYAVMIAVIPSLEVQSGYNCQSTLMSYFADLIYKRID